MTEAAPRDADHGAWLAAHALARRRLAPYAKLVWPLINPGTPLAWSWHHDLICEVLEMVTAGYHDRVILNVPPGYTKTTLVSEAWPTWPEEACEHPERRWIYASHSGDLTRAHNVIRRSILTSSWYGAAFGPPDGASLADATQKTQGFFKTKAEGWHLANSVRTAITGWHGDRRVIDDPIDASGIWTADLEACIQWWEQKFKSRARDGCATVLVMQRLHARDLAGHFLSDVGSADGDWLHVCLPERYEPKTHCEIRIPIPDGEVPPDHWRALDVEAGEVCFDDPRRADDVLDPIRFPDERVRKIWSGLAVSIRQAQRQQDPKLGDSSLYPRTVWRFWHNDPARVRALNAQAVDRAVPLVELRPEIWDRMCCAWDTTFDAEQSSDFCVALMGGISGVQIYILEEVRERMTLVRAEQVLEHLAIRYPDCGTWLLEKSANGPGIRSRYRARISGLRLVSVHGESKRQRVESATPPVLAGQVLLPHPEIAPSVHDFMGELEDFPRGRHDDRCDAFAHLVRHFVGSIRARGEDLPTPPDRPDKALPTPTAIDPDAPANEAAEKALARVHGEMLREFRRQERAERRARRRGQAERPRRTRWRSDQDLDR